MSERYLALNQDGHAIVRTNSLPEATQSAATLRGTVIDTLALEASS